MTAKPLLVIEIRRTLSEGFEATLWDGERQQLLARGTDTKIIKAVQRMWNGVFEHAIHSLLVKPGEGTPRGAK